jgi:hypothetical protein
MREWLPVTKESLPRNREAPALDTESSHFDERLAR